MNQQPAAEYLRHGQIPFFRLPMADLARGAEAYAGADAVLLGVPYDGGTTYQPGARLGPYHLRRVSALVGGWHPAHEVQVFEKIRAFDGGNVPVPPFDAALMRDLVEREVSNVLAAGAVPLIAGGDHSVTLPVLRAMAKKHGPVALVHVDAHFDASGPEVWGEAWHHGTFLRHAIEEGLVERGQLHQVGMRVYKDRGERKVVDEHRARVHPIEEVESRGIAAIGAEIRAGVGTRPVYVTIDVDGIDPSFAPGTGTPVPGGLSARETITLLRTLAGARIAGFDVMEVAPPLDHADLTVNLGAHLLFEALALLARR
ncbi:MAG TPA: agmatinase [bacterium]|nr:agmatinase [bacterium]